MLVTCIIILVLMITRSLASREASQEAKRTKAENSTLASLPKAAQAESVTRIRPISGLVRITLQI